MLLAAVESSEVIFLIFLDHGTLDSFKVGDEGADAGYAVPPAAWRPPSLLLFLFLFLELAGSIGVAQALRETVASSPRPPAWCI